MDTESSGDSSKPHTLLFDPSVALPKAEEVRERHAICIGISALTADPPIVNPNYTKSGAQMLEAGVRCAVTGKVCKRQRFSLRQDRSYVLSPEAFHCGDFPSFLCEQDFIRETESGDLTQPTLETASTSSAKLLSRSTELELLEAVRNFKDDFDAVADQISGNKEQALMQFLRLPLIDKYVEQRSLRLGVKGVIPAKAAHAKGKTIPFLKSATNPLLAVLGVVASKISPHVAAAMAREALLQFGKLEEKLEKQKEKAKAKSKKSRARSKVEVVVKKENGCVKEDEDTKVKDEPTTESSNAINENDNAVKMEVEGSSDKKDGGETSAASNGAVKGEKKPKVEEAASSTAETVGTNGTVDPTAAAAAAAEASRAAFAKICDDGVMVKIIKSAYRAGAEKAQELVEEEERHIRQTIKEMCTHVTERISLKVSELEELDGWLQGEHDTIAMYKKKMLKDIETMSQDPAIAALRQ
mmetsp:Transcript_24318/g.43140  ORF Transcript_24318/g.43140 Transcript_24318/m.43140 type:complete len:470 (-) Transcript_24318:308-1717(-)